MKGKTKYSKDKNSAMRTKLKATMSPFLRWSGWGSSWISERVLAGRDHMLRMMGGGFLFFFSPGTPSWRMMQCNPSPWRPQIVAYSISLHTVCSCHQWLLCRLCLQTRSKLEGGGAKPVKVKRTRGIMSSLTGRRGGRWREGLLP